ncbi:hypothetical protein ILUMI_17903 [Ignelater luminosus]|uniref:Uncharacterized protein n=1 Tax=Ignelater luminosus TaxID=2038154 RepID=A0A8K0G735_IGNLU|nr:hypothetical protein ILUMI_17903 [Ignelater luminosus]
MLRILHLSHMPLLERLCEYSLSQLCNLEELHVNYNAKLSTINSRAFLISNHEERHILLKKIFINNNNLSYLERGTLDMKNIENIDIKENPWSCDCLNQWLIDEVIPVYLRIDEEAAKHLRCVKPTDMENKTLYDMHSQNKTMRCLRFYESSVQSTWLLIGVVSGVLIGIAFAMFAVYIYRIKILNFGNFNYPAYSRV